MYRTAHLHAHLDEDVKKAQLQSWLLGEARVMVATGVIGCGYNYLSVRLIIHRGSFKSFVALHQDSGRLARDGRPSVSRVISSTKSRAESFAPRFLLRRTQRLDHGHGELSTAQSSFGRGRPIPTVQPDSGRTTLRQLFATMVSGVTATPRRRCRCSVRVARCSPLL